MAHAHVIVWLDHRGARIVGCDPTDEFDVVEIRSERPVPRVHRKSGPMGLGHAPYDLDYFDDVADALRDVAEVLIVGPSQTKWAFERFLDKRRPDVARHVVGVETVDRPTDRELAAFGRHMFARIDALGLEPGAHEGLAT